jgi:hypothetical protein
VAAIVNVDCRGTSGPSLMFELAGPSSKLVPLLDELRRPFSSSLFGAVYEALPNDTDLTRLRERGAVGFNFAFIGDVQNYHTERDTLANVSHASLQHQGENVLALARRLAREDLAALRSGHRVVWFDWLGLGVLGWRERTSPALAVAGLALLLAAAARAGGGTRAGIGIALRAALASLALIVACALVGAILSAVLWLASPAPIPLHPAKWLPVAAVVTASLALALTFAPRAPGPVWLELVGRWAALALLGLVLALAFPPASYLFLPAVLLAGLVALAGAGLRLGGARAAALGAAATLFLATIWLQLARGFVAAVDILALPAVGVAAALLFATAAPQSPRLPHRVGGYLFGGALIFAVAAALYPWAV